MRLRIRFGFSLGLLLATCISSDKSSIAADPPGTGGFRGRVMDAVTGQPAAGVVVAIQETKQSVSGRTDYVLRETWTDERGEYQFRNLPLLAYNVWAAADDRTSVALNSIPCLEGEPHQLDDLKLIEGAWIEGRVLTVRGQPVTRDADGKPLHIGLTGPARPRTAASMETCPVDDEGRFRLRAPPGRNFPRIGSTEIWERTFRKEKYERGVEIETGQDLTLNFRILNDPPKHLPPKDRPPRDPVRLPPPVEDEWDCAETIRDLGGWYRLDEDRHVVEINMVYNDGTGKRYDNSYGFDEALRIAPAFPRLKKLYLHRLQATDESLACLAELKGLETFFIWDATDVTDAGAMHLAHLENLQTIHLSDSQAGDGALKALAKLPKLTRISMQKNMITDEGLAHLAEMKQLQSLWVGISKGTITDEGLASLAGLENLTKLELQHSQITDAGLEHLKGLKNLRGLIVGNTPVTEEGLAKLRKDLPNLAQ